MKKHYILVLFVILLVNFLLPRLMPGDPFVFLSIEDGDEAVVYTKEQIAMYESYYGLDKPLHIQFIQYVAGVFTGDFGYSIYYKTEVSHMIANRLPWTFFIVTVSLVFSSFLGTILGVVSVRFRGKTTDRLLYFGLVVLSEIPSFILGTILLIFLAANLGWFPLSGGMTAFATYDSTFSFLGDLLHHAALPILTLTLASLGNFYLLSRNTMLTVISKDYIRTAKGKGLGKGYILFMHALKNAIPPIIARMFMSMGAMVGGAVLVENVFAYPGLGSLLREAIVARDYTLVQGVFFIIALMVLVMNWLADVVYGKLDPRVSK